MENLASHDLELEIAELSQKIEEKKRALEASKGIVRERQAVSEAVIEHFYGSAPTPASGTVNPVSEVAEVKPQAPAQDYLDALPPEAIEMVNSYISRVPSHGIRKTIAALQSEEPYLIDVFHDALVTRLYGELQARGIVK